MINLSNLCRVIVPQVWVGRRGGRGSRTDPSQPREGDIFFCGGGGEGSRSENKYNQYKTTGLGLRSDADVNEEGLRLDNVNMNLITNVPDSFSLGVSQRLN